MTLEKPPTIRRRRRNRKRQFKHYPANFDPKEKRAGSRDSKSIRNHFSNKIQTQTF